MANNVVTKKSFFAPSNMRFFNSAAAVKSPQAGNLKDFKIAFFSAQPYDRRFFDAINKKHGFNITYHTASLNAQITSMAEGANAVCAFVNDSLDAGVIETLHKQGVRAIALRCAGFNQVDLEAAKRFGIEVSRVPAYSPEAVAESIPFRGI